MQVTAIKGPNAVKRFCSNTVLLSEFHLWSKYMVSDYDGRRSKRAWPNCILCIPFTFNGIPNECWLHTWDTCVITTWRLGLWAPLDACTTWFLAKRAAERWATRFVISSCAKHACITQASQGQRDFLLAINLLSLAGVRLDVIQLVTYERIMGFQATDCHRRQSFGFYSWRRFFFICEL